MAHKFSHKKMELLESEERRRWQNPPSILQELGLKRDDVVVDLGCGTGFFARPASMQVGDSGKVYAVDISPQMLAECRRLADAEGLSNLTTVLSEETNVPLPDGLADWVLIINVLHEAEDRVAFLKEASRLLKGTGNLAIIDWRKQRTATIGPPVAERLDMQDVLTLVSQVDLKATSSPNFGMYHYSVIAQR
ncbi:MAG: class I SAM-dependent methyltransferase [Candidatus Poribacteria bacterium]